ncbi:flagellar hook capping FlgD N-terminal domain-containing protein [Pandoraea apista]|uniref:flagellar hook capping FlgD N-terminal domain-containing protein n=1 Tax=Pandoraea apista TaxID=93218 RepID=UPI000F65A734|nr:flagellar hook capping FlgD N-terminal domain-containing protein [Pandoraea apista]RRW88814.1 flagellar hook assembly protein FlgD [Pandoraea apista]RRW98073.1 flagellar hook assembly protein FlgD [Pandoraea apista]
MVNRISATQAALPSRTDLQLTPTKATPNKSAQDVFAKLLSAQIRNQNPLEPLNSEQFVTQMLQSQQTEALGAVAKQSTNSAALLENLLVVSLGSQVGTQVRVHAGALDVNEASASRVNGHVTLDHAASDVTVVLTGASGSSNRIKLGPQPKGDVFFSVQPAALGLTQGRYEIHVETGSDKALPVELDGTVRNVRLGADGKVILQVAGIGDIDTASISGFLGRRSANQKQEGI